MSEETTATVEDSAARAEIAGLQDQLRTVTAERDRQTFEKNEIVNKANAAAKERDELRARLAEVLVERDRLSSEKTDAARRADETARQLDEATAESARLRGVIDAAPSSDPLVLLWQIATQKTKALVAWIRAKIPADSPLLPWYDKAIETITRAGCLALCYADKGFRWALPRLVGLTQRAVAEIETRIAKK
jgi:hypothetical protein